MGVRVYFIPVSVLVFLRVGNGFISSCLCASGSIFMHVCIFLACVKACACINLCVLFAYGYVRRDDCVCVSVGMGRVGSMGYSLEL